MPDAPSAADLQRQMAQIRCDLDENVKGIVENARVMTDWKYYVRRYPWASVAGAAALGFLVVPRRLEIMRPDPDTLAKLAETNRLVVNPRPKPQGRGGPVAALVALLASTAVRTALGYVGQEAGKFFRAQAERPSRPSP